MPATVIAERIGWQHSITTIKDRIREIRPEYVGVDPVDRFVCKPGASAQCDLWFPETVVPSVVVRNGTAGVGDEVGVLTVHLGGDDPIQTRWRHLVWNVGTDLRVGQGPENAGVGPRIGNRRHWKGHHTCCCVCRNTGAPDPVPPPRSRNTRAWSNAPTATWKRRSARPRVHLPD